ncbi:MAG: hypothetical protein IT435_07920 [Phycisphaerales bacterium]|nr:hypothetical protein [Phycisphaerales bacterium]
MMIFVVYAALVWYAAAKWRRQWLSFVIVTLGVGLILAIMLSGRRLAEWTGIPILQMMVNGLLYPYIFLLGFIGYFIALIPRPPGEGSKRPCEHCGYDLIGHDDSATPICPECGEPIKIKIKRR